MRLRSILSIAVLVVAVAAGCAKKVDDSAVVTNIKAQMFSDAQLKDANIQVTSLHGIVTLTGTVPTDSAHLDAYKIASQMAGVTKVNDEITVGAPESAEAQQTPAEPQPEANAASTPAPQPPAEKPEHRHKEQAHKSHANSAAQGSQPETDASSEPTPESGPPQIPQQAESAPPPVAPNLAPAPPPPPQQVEIPAGTTMSIRMIDGVDSSVNKPGEIFHAAVDAPVVIGNQLVIPKNADVYVRLANATSAGRMTGKSELQLELVKLEFQGQSYPLTSSTYSLSGSSRGKDTAKKVGAGAVVGTLLGAIVGGGKGAAVGAAAGGAAGGIYQASTRGKQVHVPSETKLDFQLEQSVTVTVIPHSTAAG